MPSYANSRHRGCGIYRLEFCSPLLNEHEDDEIVTLDALTYAGSHENLAGILEHPRHEFVEGDIGDRNLVNDVVADADTIVNFAAESHVDRSIDSAKPFVSTNVEGTQTLLDAARKADIERFLQVSTDEVHGQVVAGEFSEYDPLNPRNPYAETKASADLLTQSPVDGDGSNIRKWIYGEDNCRALDLVLRKGNIGDVYNTVATKRKRI